MLDWRNVFLSGVVGHVLPKYYYVFMLLILFGRPGGTQPIVEVERERGTGDQLLTRIIQYQYVKHFNCWSGVGGGDRSALL